MNPSAPSGPSRRWFWLLLLVLGGVLAALFHQSFSSGQAVFSNDGPLGVIMAKP